MPDLEHLTDAPAGPTFRPNASRSPSSALDISLARPERVDRADRISQLRGLLEPLGRRGIAHPVAEGRDERVVAALEKHLRVLDSDAVTRRTDRAHARRDAALDVELETRPPALGDDLHDRMPNSRCVSAIVRRPSDAGRKGPRSSGRPAARAGRRGRAGKPLRSSVADRDSSYRREAGCCSAGRAA